MRVFSSVTVWMYSLKTPVRHLVKGFHNGITFLGRRIGDRKQLPGYYHVGKELKVQREDSQSNVVKSKVTGH